MSPAPARLLLQTAPQRAWAGQLVCSVGSIVAMVFAIGLVSLAVAIAGGMRLQVQQSSALSPTLEAGDLVFVKHAAPSTIEVGDIVGVHDSYGQLTFEHVTAAEPLIAGVALHTTSHGELQPARWIFGPGDSVPQVRARIPAIGDGLRHFAVPAGGLLLLLLGGGLAASLLRPNASST